MRALEKTKDSRQRHHRRFLLRGLLLLVFLYSLSVLLHEKIFDKSALMGELQTSSTLVLQQPKQMTGGKKHHWFGYFDKWCQNDDGSVLVMQSDQILNLPSLSDYIQIGLVKKDLSFEHLANTSAWNFQQGAMLQWIGMAKTSSLIFNVRDLDGEIRSAIFDSRSKLVKMLPSPIYSVSVDGSMAVTIDFKNLWLNRPEYSYFFDKSYGSGNARCGISLFFLLGQSNSRCILYEDSLWESLITTAWSELRDPLSNQSYYEYSFPYGIQHTCKRHIIHVQFSRNSRKLTFLYRVKCEFDSYKVKTFQFVMDTSGSNLWRIPVVIGSHHDFGWNDMIFINDGLGMWLVNTKTHYVRKVGSKLEVGATGGHGTFAYGDFGRDNPGIVLTDQRFLKQRDSSVYCKDTQRNDYQELWLYIPSLNHKILVHRAIQDKEVNFKQARTDMHPRWSLDGRSAFFDFYSKIHGKQIYSINIAPAVSIAKKAIAAKRRIYIDLGGHDGDTLLFFFEKISDAHLWDVYVFEPDKTNFELLSHLKSKKAWQNVNLINAAAWFEDNDLKFYKDNRTKKTGGSLIRSKYNTDEFFSTKAVDIAKFIKRRVREEDYLFLKMDIEGSEFRVLPHLIVENMLIYIDKIFIEWHERIDTSFYGAPRTYQSIFEAHGIHYQSWI